MDDAPNAEPDSRPDSHPEEEPETLLALYVKELRALYDLGAHLDAVLTKMSVAASHTELSAALRAHVGTTRTQLQRLEAILDDLEIEPASGSSDPAGGLLSLAAQAICSSDSPTCRDIGLIAAAQRLERFELGRLGAARSCALQLDRAHDAHLLATSFRETSACEHHLAVVANAIVGPASRVA